MSGYSTTNWLKLGKPIKACVLPGQHTVIPGEVTITEVKFNGSPGCTRYKAIDRPGKILSPDMLKKKPVIHHR